MGKLSGDGAAQEAGIPFRAGQINITKKKPIVPTCVVIQRANLSSGEKFCFVSILTFLIGLRSALSSVNVFGL